ncbi:MAG: UDP-N-acetylglucosamine 1-carboxyvinyltransferase, partial [Eubacteriales bacterium]|nr:UDP-N-acetylglucosamine 1-carboxyvinyltransferase [Eubacteriales bacterium]
MSRFVIAGGNKLKGEIRVHGAKNAALPILAAAI